MRIALIIVNLVFLCSALKAQEKLKPDTTVPEKSFGKASLNFINNDVYSGRKDSLTTPYLTPSIGYYDKSGFYIEGSASYLVRSGSGRFDVFTIGAGYDHMFGNLELGISGEKYFYNSSSTNVSAEIKGDFSASISYDLGFLRPWISPGISLGKKTDYSVSMGLDHSFYVDNWDITPTFSLNAETRNFYASYFGNRRFRPKKGPNAPTVTATMQDASKLKILDYEFSLPVNYTLKHFTFGFTPAYAIPQNAAQVIIVTKPVSGSPSTKTFTEKISNTFYFSLEIAYQF